MAKSSTNSRDAEHGHWFTMYKPTQGYWTRVCTAGAIGSLVLWGAHWLNSRLEVFANTQSGLIIQIGATVAWIVAFALLLYWIVGKKQRTVDFFIAVEGEVKKVNWSSRQEVIGATKVVMLFVFLMSVMLGLVDLGFMTFFSAIGVLQRGL